MDSTPTSVRNRRSLTRVNYAEDFVVDSTPDIQVDVKLKPGIKRTSNGSSTKDIKPLSDRDQAAQAVKDRFAMNWQRKFSPTEKLSMAMNFNGARLVKGSMHLVDGTVLQPEDHVYILSEPPGEPYYIGRIMEFVEKESRSSASKNPPPEDSTQDTPGRRPRSRSTQSNAADMYQVRVNWLYRQSDASRNTTDSRMLFATMHSDLCPLHGLRGKCTVKVKNAIKDLDSYTKTPNCFYFSQLYDRYINRFFDIIPTDKITNLPPKLHQMLTSNFKYAVVESGRGKDLMGAPQSCEKCLQWCSSEDSVQCAHCKHNYHMLCLDPPIYRKPARGFGWSCASCSGALERKLEENKGLQAYTRRSSGDEDEEETTESDLSKYPDNDDDSSRNIKSNTGSVSPSIGRSRYEELEAAVEQALNKEISEEQHRLQKMWPFRYLGMHSKLEDVLEFDDRIYPKAASRLGSKHQCPVPDWPGRPVIYVEPAKTSKKKGRNNIKNRTKQNANQTSTEDSSESTQDEALSSAAALPKRERPPWIQDKPSGYIERGGESTSTLHWRSPSDHLERINAFLEKAKPYAEKLHMKAYSANFIDAALEAFMDCSYEEGPALQIVSTFTRKSLKEPTFTEEEKRRFEEGVRKYGSQLHPVYKEVATKTSADVVRYYYLWKKTPAGKAVRESSASKKAKKAEIKHSHEGLVDEVADSGDDSAYDNDKAKSLKRSFICKFCNTTAVREWRRAPGNPVADDNNPIVALCLRCARLWRRYAVVWEEPDEVMKMVSQRSGQGAKRRIEHELIEDAKAIYAERNKELERERTRKKMRVEKQQKSAIPIAINKDTKAKSRIKTESKISDKLEEVANDKEVSPSIQSDGMTFESSTEPITQTKTETSSRFKQSVDGNDTEWPILPCSVCKEVEPLDKQLYCMNCGLNVHRQCYGISENTPQSDWLCDTCKNDQNPLISTLYTCNLCPVREHTADTVTNGSMLTDGFKRTQDNNWVHVRCAIWNQETKFGDAAALQPVESITRIPKWRREAVCEICGTNYGPCVTCEICKKLFHVGCANKLGFGLGFGLEETDLESNITPITIAGRKGHLKPMIICSEHPQEMKTLIRMGYIEPETKQNVLQLYVNRYRQANKSITGAMRRSQMFTMSKESGNSEDSPHEALELVVSTGNGKDEDTVYSRESVNCSICRKTNSAYWLKGIRGSILCHQCYWMEKDPELYRNMFPNIQSFSMIDPEIYEKDEEKPIQRTKVSLNDILS